MSENLTVTAKVPAKAAAGDKPAVSELGPCTIIVQTGKDNKEMEQLFGGEAVKTNAEANWSVTLQGNIRSGLRKGETPDQIAARLKDAKMGVAQKGIQVDPVQAYLAKFQGATPKEQQNMLADLKKRAAATATA
jgi:hypothetical protein